MHAVAPCVLLHAVSQSPQCAVVVSEVSQPVSARPSQLPQPLVQAMPHRPALQEGVPLTVLHTVPQAPQWVTLVLVLVSHPLFV